MLLLTANLNSYGYGFSFVVSQNRVTDYDLHKLANKSKFRNKNED